VAIVTSAPPAITTPPISQTVNVAESASFSVTATGYLLNYQWRKNGTDISGATGATCQINLAEFADAGSYTVVVSNFLGSATSSPPAVLTVTAPLPGAVVAWGNDDHGQSTVPAAAQSGVVAIAAGWNHTLALKSNGSVLAWGSNNVGQTNVPVGAQSGVTAIAAGLYHNAALKSDGSVVVWEDDSGGQSTVPVAAQSGVTAIAAGGFYTAALKNGSVVVWGGQPAAPPAAQSGVTAIAAGTYHTVALKNDGSVVAWGDTSAGQTTVPAAAQSGVIAIAAGFGHTAALKNDGSVVTWGDNGYGQTNVPAAAQSGVVAIAAGWNHTLALKTDGSLVAWGNYEDGQTYVPATVQGVITAIAGGGFHTVALVDPEAPLITLQPTSETVNAGQSATFTVAVGSYHPLSFQWRKDGVNLSGATGPTYRVQNAWFGDAGTYTVQVSNYLGTVISAPAGLAVNRPSPNSVVAWGYNIAGQTDVPLAAQSGVNAIAAGYFHTLALDR
jgi:hypothetical protein